MENQIKTALEILLTNWSPKPIKWATNSCTNYLRKTRTTCLSKWILRLVLAACYSPNHQTIKDFRWLPKDQLQQRDLNEPPPYAISTCRYKSTRKTGVASHANVKRNIKALTGNRQQWISAHTLVHLHLISLLLVAQPHLATLYMTRCLPTIAIALTGQLCEAIWG